jgi:hypothetical protein
MNSLSRLEEYFIAAHLTFDRWPEGLMLNVQPSVCAPVLVVENGKDWFDAQVAIPLRKEVTRLEILLESVRVFLNESDEDDFEIGDVYYELCYSAQEATLYVKSTFMEEGAEVNLETFLLIINYCLLPLFNYVEDMNTWDNQILELSFHGPGEVGGLIHGFS